MKKTTLPLFVLSAMALGLASCSINQFMPSSSAEGNSGSDGSDSQVTSQAGPETSNSGAYETSISMQSADVFPAEAFNAFLTEHSIQEQIPTFEAPSFQYVVGVDQGVDYIYVEGLYADEATALEKETSYSAAITEVGFEVLDMKELFGTLIAVTSDDNLTVMFGAVDNAFALQVSYGIPEEESGSWDSDIDWSQESIEYLSEFPADELAAFLATYDITIQIPSFDAPIYGGGLFEDGGMEGYEIYGNYETLEAAQQVMEDYAVACGKAGFIVEEGEDEYGKLYSIADPDNLVDIEAYADEDEDGPYFCIDVYPMVAFTPELDGSVISFADEQMLTTKDGKKSIWTGEGFTFTVEKGQSTLEVGNKNYFSNPLRLYDKQMIIVESLEPMDTINFLVNTEAAKSTVEKLTGSTASVGTWDNDGDLVSLTLPAETTKVTITLDGTASSQVHLDAMSVVPFAQPE